MLHIIAKSPVEIRILDRIGAGDAVLFIRSAVFTVLSDHVLKQQIKKMLSQNALFVLSSDLVARGVLPEELLNGIEIIDYADFVELTIEHSVIQSWG